MQNVIDVSNGNLENTLDNAYSRGLLITAGGVNERPILKDDWNGS